MPTDPQAGFNAPSALPAMNAAAAAIARTLHERWHSGEPCVSDETINCADRRFALGAAVAAVGELRSLSVYVRMEAMGMREVTIGQEADPFYVEPFTHVPTDGLRTYWTDL